ncbi:MAG TPA: GIY-YIG nuclease family protein [Ignavibacteria bacterium]|nr:endonuclease [Bacteroidota bacterium]HRF65868.1 GIY-YIG nuclease family protein [Ignavibacteria bacterium]
MSNSYYVYILASKRNGTIYTGVTNNLLNRLYSHKNKLLKGFSSRYNVNRLVFFEETGDIFSAIEREKEIKGWRRSKKLRLIESTNPTWKDLSEGWFN